MALALTLLVVLLRLKIKLGRSMLLSSIALAILLRVTPGDFWHTVVNEWHNKPLNQTTGYLFLTLTLLVISVNVLGLKSKEITLRVIVRFLNEFQKKQKNVR